MNLSYENIIFDRINLAEGLFHAFSFNFLRIYNFLRKTRTCTGYTCTCAQTERKNMI